MRDKHDQRQTRKARIEIVDLCDSSSDGEADASLSKKKPGKSATTSVIAGGNADRLSGSKNCAIIDLTGDDSSDFEPDVDPKRLTKSAAPLSHVSKQPQKAPAVPIATKFSKTEAVEPPLENKPPSKSASTTHHAAVPASSTAIVVQTNGKPPQDGNKNDAAGKTKGEDDDDANASNGNSLSLLRHHRQTLLAAANQHLQSDVDIEDNDTQDADIDVPPPVLIHRDKRQRASSQTGFVLWQRLIRARSEDRQLDEIDRRLMELLTGKQNTRKDLEELGVPTSVKLSEQLLGKLRKLLLQALELVEQKARGEGNPTTMLDELATQLNTLVPSTLRTWRTENPVAITEAFDFLDDLTEIHRARNLGVNKPLMRLEDDDPRLAVLKEAFYSTTSQLVLAGVWETNNAPAAFPTSYSSYLLAHCSRNLSAAAIILSEGLQIKGVGGRLGKGIYMSNDLSKCMQYCAQIRLSDGQVYGVIFLVEAVLGNAKEFSQDKPYLFSPPGGFNSVHGVGQRSTLKTQPITFADGRTAKVFIGPVEYGLHPKSHGSYFEHTEFVVYCPSRVQVRFVLLFRNGAY